jgi:hypothetical protein
LPGRIAGLQKKAAQADEGRTLATPRLRPSMAALLCAALALVGLPASDTVRPLATDLRGDP